MNRTWVLSRIASTLCGSGPLAGLRIKPDLAAEKEFRDADLNKDGAPDLVVACATDGTATVLLSQGAGFASPASYPVGAEPVAVTLGDLDGDQVLDAAVVNRSGGTVSVLRGRAGGLLEAAGTLGVGIEPEAVVIGDLDADGKNDLAVANTGSGTISVLWGPR